MVVLHRNRPEGLRPRGLGEKQKRRAGQCLHSVRRDPSSCDTAAGTPRQNHPLQERPDYRIIFHAVRPDGRCVGGISTCAGFRVLAHSETAAFLFFRTIIAGNAVQCKRKSDVQRPAVMRQPPGETGRLSASEKRDGQRTAHVLRSLSGNRGELRIRRPGSRRSRSGCRSGRRAEW